MLFVAGQELLVVFDPHETGPHRSGLGLSTSFLASDVLEHPSLILTMPRGIPNAKRDESAMRFTSFHVPLASVPSFEC